MGMRYTMVNQLPENKMRLYPTKVINIIGGPGCGKSLFKSTIVLNLLVRHHTVETVPDFAKILVWQQDFESLKNQYAIAQRQYEMLNVLDGQVEFIVTEGSLPKLLFYNEYYEDNVCDVAKTRTQILDWYNQHNNINVMVRRGDEGRYNQAGRLQNEEGAHAVDRGLRDTLAREGIRYTFLEPDVKAIHAFAATLVDTPAKKET